MTTYTPLAMGSNAALLDNIARALYGDRYKPALAAALGVDSRRIRQWLSPPGSRSYRPVPPGVWDELYTAALRRQHELFLLQCDISCVRQLVREHRSKLDEVALALEMGILPADVDG